MSQYSPEAREIELDAFKRVTSYYSSDHILVDLGNSDGYDFEIHHVNRGLVAIGEVSWLEDPIKKSDWAALLKQKEQHRIPLNPGQGYWSMSIKHGAHIGTITQKLPHLINLMHINSETERQIYETWPHDEISIELRKLHIEYLRKVEDPKFTKDECFFLFEGSGGIIPDTLEPLANFLLNLINSNYRDCLKKLDIQGDIDRHLCFRMGSYLPFNLIDPLGRHNLPVEIGKFNFPTGITHVWLIASNENFRSVLWSENSRYLD